MKSSRNLIDDDGDMLCRDADVYSVSADMHCHSADVHSVSADMHCHEMYAVGPACSRHLTQDPIMGTTHVSRKSTSKPGMSTFKPNDINMKAFPSSYAWRFWN